MGVKSNTESAKVFESEIYRVRPKEKKQLKKEKSNLKQKSVEQ